MKINRPDDSMKNPDSNNHRIGKFRVDANLTKEEAQAFIDALVKSGCKSQRELIVLLCEQYNKGRI
ncbi:MAG: hypothetical protein ACRCXG_16295 [Vibrio sp.]